MEDLTETCSTLDTCNKRPEKYMAKALKPIVEFRTYRTVDSGEITEFCSLLRYVHHQEHEESGSSKAAHQLPDDPQYHKEDDSY